MRVVSVNVGLPREVVWQGNPVRTGIFKDPVAAPVPLRRLNLDGDAQADLSVHGGPDKAVYAYPHEHYDDWQAQLGRDLPYGAFLGENLTTQGLVEDSVQIDHDPSPDALRCVLRIPVLAAVWRQEFEERIGS